MKNILLLLLFITGTLYAQPPIAQPANLTVCDDNSGDGIEVFDLTINEPQILNGLNPTNFTITYHTSQMGADTNTNLATPANAYVGGPNQTIFVRVEENANPTNYATTSFDLIVNPLPTASIGTNTICAGTSGTLSFMGTPNATVQYTVDGGSNQSLVLNASGNAILTTPILFSNSTYTLIDVTSLTGCTKILTGSSTVFVIPLPTASITTNSPICSIDMGLVALNGTPNTTVQYTINGGSIQSVILDPNGLATLSFSNLTVDTTICLVDATSSTTPACSQTLTACETIVVNQAPNISGQNNVIDICDDNNDGFSTFNLTMLESQILSSVPQQATITYFETIVNAQTASNPIVNPTAYSNFTPYTQVVFARVQINATGCFALTTITIRANLTPIIIQPQNFVIYENPYDGFATFDLTLNEADMINGTTGLTFQYYFTLMDAQFDSNPISNPTAFVNFTNPQTIYVRAENNATGCFSITNFDLVVIDSATGIVYIPDIDFKAKLIALGVDTNTDGEIQFTEALVPTSLNVSNSNISDLTGIEAFTNLQSLVCSNNFLTNLNLSQNLNLLVLNCNYNSISNLNISSNNILNNIVLVNNLLTSFSLTNFPQLTYLDLNSNSLTSLTLTNVPNLQVLDCDFNQLTSLDVSGLNNLYALYCKNNILSNLNITGDINLYSLDCSHNLLTNIDFSNLNALTIVLCNNNQLTSLDFSLASSLESLACSTNNLTSINIKNGHLYINTNNFWNANPNLAFICADDDELVYVAQIVNQSNLNNVVFNSYCSFTPGGNFNTISGVAQFDLNNNGCDVNDFPVQFLSFGVNLNAVSTNSSVYTNNLGTYSLFTNQTGTFGLTPNLENPTYFNVTPNPASVNIPVIDNSTTTQNFCITPNGVHPDLEIVIAPITPARPGFDAVYLIVYKNIGNTTLSQQYGINFFYDENVLDFVSTTYATSSSGSGSLSWDYANLKPFENRSFYVTLNVNSPTETPAVNIGDVLTLTTSILPSAGDENTFNNLFQYNQTVVGSYDPNDITCLQGEVVSPSYIGQYLHYVINFENTGTYQAENVVLKTEINPADFDITTLRLLNASHNVATRINNNVVEFVFENCNLDTGGHGNILLKIKTKDNLLVSDFVTNKADIYFDYNFPIETNLANTTFQVLSNSIVTIDNSVGVYPNPTNDVVNIKANSEIKSIEIYDVQGRIIQTKITNQNIETIDVSNYANGIYFLKIKTEFGEKAEKLVKE